MTTELIGRLRRHIATGRSDVVLVAPFMKAGILELLLASAPEGAAVTCVTRWRAEEVSGGVSDLEVFDVCANRGETKLYLRHDLHAKYYRADKYCLIGSANVTGSALGLGKAPNFEILVQVPSDHDDLVGFEVELLSNAIVANERIREQVAAAVKILEDRAPVERSAVSTELVDESETAEFGDWLPRCSVPQELFSIYVGDRSHVAKPVFEDGCADLETLDVPLGLGADAFRSVIASRLVQHPILGNVIRVVEEGVGVERSISSALPQQQVPEDARVLMAWMRVFFPLSFRVSQDFES